MSGRSFLFAGGGTGGHLFPALAIAEELVKLDPVACVRFLASDRPLDAEILHAQKLRNQPVDFEAIPAKPLHMRPLALARFIASWGGAVRAGRVAIAREKRAGRSVRVISGGGFVAAPVVQAARAENVSVLMLNLDAAPGLANKWIARHAGTIVTTAPVPGRPIWKPIPPIVRAAAVGGLTKQQARTAMGLSPDLPTLLVTGASQGARSMNAMMAAICEHKPDTLRGWQVIHQTGKSGVEETAAAYAAAGVPALVRAFFDGMGQCWNAADVALSRAGAGSVAEAWANRVPTLFMPYPYHKDEHQKWNAKPLVDAGAALLAKDAIEPKANMQTAAPLLAQLLADAAKRDQMRASLVKLGPADGAARVARMLLE